MTFEVLTIDLYQLPAAVDLYEDVTIHGLTLAGTSELQISVSGFGERNRRWPLTVTPPGGTPPADGQKFLIRWPGHPAFPQPVLLTLTPPA